MRNIILLSDGTGNGAAKKNRTNVWRLYSALDLHNHNQVAFFDDGVGSQEFLLFKILGGAIGWGLKRNVLELYKFLCRSYKDGDNIYLFGFSRGSFTVRLLAAMVAHCGLCTGYKNEEDLHKSAEKNYRAYIYRPRPERNKWSKLHLGHLYYRLTGGDGEPQNNVRPKIKFIGVWDTVDAYGFPFDELAILWDRLISPLRFPDQQLSEKVGKACHALCVDDERHTFHPLLWDEGEAEKKRVEEQKVAPDRIEQVWFAGVHSDVGGGYSMYQLALVSLDWMIEKVEDRPGAPGLHFIQGLRQEYKDHADWHGMQHDSRAGLAAYYRYKPRNLEHLCNDEEAGVHIDRPNIHRSVLERIKGNIVPYAPLGLPASYQVVSTRGNVPFFEDKVQAGQRKAASNSGLDLVFWRRRLYMALLVATLVLIVSRFFLDWSAEGICQGAACLIDPLLEQTRNALPDFTAGWFEAWQQNPAWLWGFIATLSVLFYIKMKALGKTQARAMAAWAQLKGNGSPPVWRPTFTSKLRQAARSNFCKASKWIAARVVFLLILLLLVVLAGRAAFFIRSTLGLCYEKSPLATITESAKVSFAISAPAFASGILLQEGETYRFAVADAEWYDGKYEAGPDGFDSSGLGWGVVLRRKVSQPWLKLMGRIGNTGKEDFVIGAGPMEYQAKSSGELFLYVNDAVFGLLPGRFWAWPYFWELGKNKGKAVVTVSRLPAGENG